MLSMRSLAMAVLGCLVGAVSGQADDAGDVLLSAREALGNLHVAAKVTLQRRGGTWRITGVNVSFQNPADSDLSQFADLKTLETLELRGDSQVTAEGIRKLAGLQELRRLSLPWNTTESGLKAISPLPNLEDLEMRVTDQVGNDGLGHLKSLPRLRRLHLAGKGLSNASIKFVRLLKDLEELDLSYTSDPKTVRITDAAVAKLTGLRGLRVLKLDRLGARGMSALMTLPNLQRLDVDFYAPAPGETDLSRMRNLKWLSIAQIPGNRAVKVRLPKNLQRLEISSALATKLDFRSCEKLEAVEIIINTDRRKGDLNWLSVFPSLRELSLLYQAANQDVKTLANLGLTSLRSLTLMGGPEPLGDEGLRALRGLPNLEAFHMPSSACATVTDAGLQALRDMKSLRVLDIALGRDVTANGLANIWELEQLRVLHLSLPVRLRRSIDGVLAHVAELGELEELSVGGTLTDDGLSRLTALKKLRRLELTRNRGYTDHALESLMNTLPDLQVVEYTCGRPPAPTRE